jgi:VWFA-related protein
MGGYLNRRRAAVLFWACAVLCGQDAPTFSTGVKVVNLLATVRTKKGQIVHDLSQEDFSVTENGRAQNIRYFARESDLPLTLGLMVDTSMSQRRVLDAERGASFRFLDQVLRANKDQIFIMQFDLSVPLRQELTSSRRKLDDALVYVDTPTNRELQFPTSAGTLLYRRLAPPRSSESGTNTNCNRIGWSRSSSAVIHSLPPKFGTSWGYI